MEDIPVCTGDQNEDLILQGRGVSHGEETRPESTRSRARERDGMESLEGPEKRRKSNPGRRPDWLAPQVGPTDRASEASGVQAM